MRYLATITREGDATLAEFPDAPGCQTFTRGDDIAERAQEAIEGWLEAQLADREIPPRPRKSVTPRKGATVLPVPITPALGVRLALRWARDDAGLSQAQVARRMGVSQQAYALLESPDANISMKTLEKAAEALGLVVHVALEPAELAMR